MLTFLPVTEPEKLEILYHEAGEQWIENHYAVESHERDTRSGYCLFSLEADKLWLHTMRADEGLVFEGLVRASLYFGANRGAYIAKCSVKEYEDVLLPLGFAWQGNVLAGEIPTILARCKNV